MALSITKGLRLLPIVQSLLVMEDQQRPSTHFKSLQSEECRKQSKCSWQLPMAKFWVLAFLLCAASPIVSQSSCEGWGLPSQVLVGCNGDCETITASLPEFHETTDYVVDSMEFSPPLPIGAGTQQVIASSGYTDAIDLPFGFSFFNSDFFQLKANRRGFLTFNVGLGGGYNYPNQPLGSASLPPNSIMAPFAYTSNSGVVINTATLGEAPCRQFVISWEDLPLVACGTNQLSTQVVLHETTNEIEVHVESFETCLDIPACLGIQGSSWEEGYGPEEYNTGQFSITEESFRFAPSGESVPSELLYFSEGQLIGSGDSVVICTQEPTELIIASNLPEVLPPPPAPGSCDEIPGDACDTIIVYDYNLGAAQTGALNFDFDAELLGFAITNNWTSAGGSWPGDMGFQICDSGGTCGFIEGFNIDLSGTNLGDFPSNWNTTLGGFYESCFTVPPGMFGGGGSWTITIQNGWTGSGGGVNFDGTVTLFFTCPNEEDTSDIYLDSLNFQHVLTLVPSFFGLSDSCANDVNENGICDEEEPLFCGEGTSWSEVNMNCISVACTGDLNSDGTVTVVDLLLFLPNMSLGCPTEEELIAGCQCELQTEPFEYCSDLCASAFGEVSGCESEFSELCGAGSIWSSEFQQCIPFIPCPYDFSGDGGVTVSDLLLLLANFQLAC